MKWKSIPSFPEYEVSENGIVRRGGYILKQGFTVEGYPRCSFRLNGKSHVRRVHTLVAEAFIGKRPKDYDVCHNDGSKNNNHFTNLRYDTRKNNCLDAVKHGTSNQGSDHGEAKLNEKLVLEIRQRYKNGESIQKMAKELGLHRTTLYYAVKKDTWKHI